MLVARKRKRRSKARPEAFAIRTILVPTDFSQCALAGAEYTAFLARTLGATLRLFHAIYPYTNYVFVDRAGVRLSGLVEAVEETARQEIDALKQMNFLSGLPVQTQTLPGHAVDENAPQRASRMWISSLLPPMAAQDSNMRSSGAWLNMSSATRFFSPGYSQPLSPQILIFGASLQRTGLRFGMRPYFAAVSFWGPCTRIGQSFANPASDWRKALSICVRAARQMNSSPRQKRKPGSASEETVFEFQNLEITRDVLVIHFFKEKTIIPLKYIASYHFDWYLHDPTFAKKWWFLVLIVRLKRRRGRGPHHDRQIQLSQRRLRIAKRDRN